MNTKACKASSSRAFTLIELLVSVSIMTMILGITLSGGPTAIMRLSLSDNVYATELILREAQLQGSAVSSLNDTFGGAGVIFDLASPTIVTKFRDRVDPAIPHAIGIGDGLYQTSPVSEFDSFKKITGNHKITNVCVTQTVPPFVCNAANTPSIDTLTISFTRPKQGANIYVNSSTAINYSAACIQVDSLRAPAQGFVRSIIVYRSGMILKKIGTCASVI